MPKFQIDKEVVSIHAPRSFLGHMWRISLLVTAIIIFPETLGQYIYEDDGWLASPTDWFFAVFGASFITALYLATYVEGRLRSYSETTTKPPV